MSDNAQGSTMQTNTFIGVLFLLAAMGLMLLGAHIFGDEPKGAEVLYQTQLLKYNREIVEQQQMVINALEQSNQALVKDRDAIVEQANGIIKAMQNDATTTKTAESAD